MEVRCTNIRYESLVFLAFIRLYDKLPICSSVILRDVARQRL